MSKVARIRKTFSIIIFILLLFAVFCKISKIMQRKIQICSYEPFFEEADQIDVLLFGTSHMACGVSPMYMWKKYGITSYNLGSPGEPLPVSYWKIVMACDYCSPKVVVVDVGAYTVEEKYNEDLNDSHYSFDAFPLSKLKVDAVNDLIDNRNKKIEYLVTAGKYHDRWDELSKEDFTDNPSKQKGTLMYGEKIRMLPSSGKIEFEPLTDTSEFDDNMNSKVYLEKIILFCKSNNILPVLVANPFACSTIEQPYINGVSAIAKTYGIPYFNFMNMNSVVDFDTDMMDEQHTNITGMNKVSDYLGNALALVVDNHKEDSIYNNWNEDYIKFLSLKDEVLANIKEAQSILSYISDEDYASFVYVDGNSTFWEDDQNISLVQNIVRNHVLDNSGIKSCDINLLTEISNASDNDADYFLAAQGSGEEFIELSGDEDVNSINSIGEFDYYKNDSGDPVLIVHGYDDSVNLFEYEDNKPDVQIVVFNKTTQELIINTKWKMGSNTINQL